MTQSEPTQDVLPAPRRPRWSMIVLWAIILGLVGAVGGGAIGYFAAGSRFVCTGMVRVRPVLPVILSRTEENAPMTGGSFELFVQTQVQLIQSSRVVDKAMSSDDWKKLGRGSSTDRDAYERFLKNLEVKATQGEHIFVSFTDPDEKAASAAVKSVLEAYRLFYVEGESKDEADKRKIIEDRRLALLNDVRAREEAIRQISKDYGTDDLRSLLQAKMSNLSRWEATQADIEVEMAGLLGPRGGFATTRPATQPAEGLAGAAASGRQAPQDVAASKPEGLNDEQIGLRDVIMRQLLLAREQARSELESLLQSLGDQNLQVKQARRLLEAKEAAVERYGNDIRAAMKLAVGTPAASGSLSSGLSPEQLVYRRAMLAKIIDTEISKIKEISNRLQEIEKLRSEREALQHELDRTQRRLDELSIESKSQGRVTVASFGDKCVETDSHRLVPASAGAGAGFVLFFAITMLVGIGRRRRLAAAIAFPADPAPLT